MATYASWRWTFVLLGSAGVAVLFSIFFFLPETLDLSPEAKKKRLRPNPFRSIGYLKYPMVAICFTCAVIMMMAIFTYISNFGRELNDYYHMNSAQVGLMYLPHTIANIPGNVLAGIMADWAIRRSRAQHGRSIPEYRLLVTASGFIGFPLGIMLMAWGIRNVLPVWVLCIAGALIGFNQFTVYTPLQTYLVDIFPTQSASIISLVNLGRYTIAAVAPMVVLAATEAMGAWYLTMWAILVILCGVPVLAVGKFGTKWRESYPPWQPKMEAVEGKGTADEEAVTIGSRGEMDEKAGGKSGEAVGDETVSERTNSSTEAAPSEEVAK